MPPATSLLSLPLLGRALLPLLSTCPSGTEDGNGTLLPAFRLLLLRLSRHGCPRLSLNVLCPTTPGLFASRALVSQCLPCAGEPWAGHSTPDVTSLLNGGENNRVPVPGVSIKPGTQLSNITVQLRVTPPSGNALALFVQVSWEQGRDRSQLNRLPCRTWCWSLLGNVSKLPIRSHREIMKCCLQKSYLYLVYNERQRLKDAVSADRTAGSRNHRDTNIGPHFTLFQTKSILQSLTMSTAHGHSLQTSCARLCWRMLMLITIQSTQTRESLIKNIWQAMIMFIHNCQDAYTCYARSSYCK